MRARVVAGWFFHFWAEPGYGERRCFEMKAASDKTVVLFSGLPYSGKTALIHRLLEKLQGEAVYVDGLFRDLVSEEEVCLERWLKEGPRLVEGIIDRIAKAAGSPIYVEVGILPARYRGPLIRWIRDHGYRLIPILLRCESREVVQKRQQARARALGAQPEKLKIAIDLDELYGPINAAFDEIEAWEGYHAIDTDASIEKNVEEICRLIKG